ncbi:MAG: MFS transporter [Asgard group archaeon]|nr:MFS transporter [Asgard group archaeon]
MVMLSEEKSDINPQEKVNSDKPSLLNILRNKSYMLVYGGQITNLIASLLGGMTFSYLIYSTTHNAALMALMGILGSLPTVLIVTFAGVIVDRFDQRKLILISTILRAVFILGFLLIFVFQDNLIQHYTYLEPLNDGVIQRFYVTNYIHFIWPMYLLLFLNNMVFTFYNLTTTTYTKYIVEKKDLLVTNSFNSTIFQIANVIGPILAGMLITVSYLYSFAVATIIASIPAMLSLILIYKGKKPPQKEIKEKVTFRKELSRGASDMKVGFNTIRSEPKVLYVLIVYVAFNFVASSINSTFSVVLQGELNLNATWYGSVVAVMSGFGIITSLVIMFMGKIKRKLIIVNLVIILETVGLFLFTFIRNPWFMLFLVTIPFGFVNGSANIPSNTLRQEKIPHEKLGRATSVVFMFTSLANLTGMVIVTFITNSINPMYITLVGSILCLLLSIVSLIVFLSKRNLRCSDYQKESKEIDIEKESLIDILVHPEEIDRKPIVTTKTSSNPTK